MHRTAWGLVGHVHGAVAGGVQRDGRQSVGDAVAVDLKNVLPGGGISREGTKFRLPAEIIGAVFGHAEAAGATDFTTFLAAVGVVDVELDLEYFAPGGVGDDPNGSLRG